MAIMWNGSLVPNIDPNGAPYSGMRAYFFDAGTTTPRTVYRDSGLGESHDHPVIANASGKFPAVFLPPGDYRLRMEDANGVTLDDVDGISTPSAGETTGGGGGDTPVDLLVRTGTYIFRHSTGSLSGYVRANSRTIGNASSGATERASADCEALFILLWADATLTVTGGRGANASSDWAASKQISLPDVRNRVLAGLASMGAAAANLLTGLDGGETADTLGATVGVGNVTLTTAQMPKHKHTGSTDTDSHRHGYHDDYVGDSGPGIQAGTGRDLYAGDNRNTDSYSHAHGFETNQAGNSEAHTNTQPTLLATIYIKL